MTMSSLRLYSLCASNFLSQSTPTIGSKLALSLVRAHQGIEATTVANAVLALLPREERGKFEKEVVAKAHALLKPSK